MTLTLGCEDNWGVKRDPGGMRSGRMNMRRHPGARKSVCEKQRGLGAGE